MADVNTVTDPAGVNANEVDQQGGNSTPEITLPQSVEELQALLQSEGDKRVASAIRKREDKLKADYEAKIEKEKAEAAKLAKMTQTEREKAIFDAERKAFEEERKSFAKTQLLNQTMVELQKESLPVTFAEYMMADTAEEVVERINSFKTVWQEALQVAVDERIKSKTPKAGTSNSNAITKEDFKKMTYRERAALYDSNPELYKSLNK